MSANQCTKNSATDRAVAWGCSVFFIFVVAWVIQDVTRDYFKNRAIAKARAAEAADYARNKCYRLVLEIEEESGPMLFGQIKFSYSASVQEVYRISEGIYTNLFSAKPRRKRFSMNIISERPLNGQTMPPDAQLQLVHTAIERMKLSLDSAATDPDGVLPMVREAYAANETLALADEQKDRRRDGVPAYLSGIGSVYTQWKAHVRPSCTSYGYTEGESGTRRYYKLKDD